MCCRWFIRDLPSPESSGLWCVYRRGPCSPCRCRRSFKGNERSKFICECQTHCLLVYCRCIVSTFLSHKAGYHAEGASLSEVSVCIYLGFYVTFNTVQVISRWVVGRAEETSTYSSSGFCTVNCRPTASNYQLSHLRPYRESNPSLGGGSESVTTLPPWPLCQFVRL